MQLFISPSTRDIKTVKTELEQRKLFDKSIGVVSQDGIVLVATNVLQEPSILGETKELVETREPSITVSANCKYFLRARAELPVSHDSNVQGFPKRYSLYGSMALFTAGSFKGWDEPNIRKALSQWLEDKPSITHVAVNSPISKNDNDIRHPGITRLLGEWGPSPIGNPELYDNPTENDFSEAYWVTTTQNDIKQCWAPMYTMFSRGNIKEKARILNSTIFQSARDNIVVDLYCGIGYFFFSYAQLKPRLLLGWDINPWSIEGLRRGAGLAKLSLQVVKNGDTPNWALIGPPGTTHAIVFNESNEHATRRIEELRSFLKNNDATPQEKLQITHINMGLLPDCKQSWEIARILAVPNVTTYHVHENVAMKDVDKLTLERSHTFGKHLHTEMVKTFAPGVGHIVWDFQAH